MSYNVHPPRGDVKRLPKWAQEHIDSLGREIERQDNHIADISSTHPGSNVVLDTKSGRPDVSLPPDSTVRFYLGEGREDHRDLIEVHHNRQDLKALEVSSYGGPMNITPRVSNGISLRIQDKW